MPREAVLDVDASFWRLARQTALYTADPVRSLDTLTAEWKRVHPDAAAQELDGAVARLRGLLGVM